MDEQKLPIMNTNEVADMFRVDATTVRRWALAGLIPFIPLPGREKKQYRFVRSEMEARLHSIFLTKEEGPE